MSFVAGTKLCFSRVWELYGKDIIVIALILGAATSFIISIPIGVAVTYVCSVVLNAIFSAADRPPFEWVGNTGKIIFIALGPLTITGILVGSLAYFIWMVVFLPFIILRKESWAVGATIYYVFCAVVALIVYMAV